MVIWHARAWLYTLILRSGLTAETLRYQKSYYPVVLSLADRLTVNSSISSDQPQSCLKLVLSDVGIPPGHGDTHYKSLLACRDPADNVVLAIEAPPAHPALEWDFDIAGLGEISKSED